jgi:hypothetical protein
MSSSPINILPPNPSTQATPVSKPAPRPLPSAATYGFSELALFTMYNRDTYRQTFGMDAPPYDASRLTKGWFDSTLDTSQPGNTVAYHVMGQDAAGTWGIRQMVIATAEASTVNLPGAITYPAYMVAPSLATRGGSTLNPIYLSLESEAHELMAELGGTDLGVEELPGFAVTYQPEEARRLWYFMLGGRHINVGGLLYSKNSNGVGAPGAWDLSTGAPVWVPAVISTGLDDTRAPRDMPVRDLYPNEAFQNGLMGTIIIRTDLVQQSGGSGSGSQFTDADRKMLQTIYDAVTRA